MTGPSNTSDGMGNLTPDTTNIPATQKAKNKQVKFDVSGNGDDLQNAFVNGMKQAQGGVGQPDQHMGVDLDDDKDPAGWERFGNMGD